QVLLLRPEGVAEPNDPLVTGLLDSGWKVLSVDLRATGAGKPETGEVRGVADHNEAEWGLWIGRPLLGQWSWDASRWFRSMSVHGLPRGGTGLDALPNRVGRNVIAGIGPMGVVAVLAAAFDARASGVAIAGGPVSFVGEGPWAKLPMGIIAPNILEVG